MSAGPFVDEIYVSNLNLPFPVRVQPETLTLTLNAVANVGGTGPVQPGLPSAKVSGSRGSIGVNCRKVRVRFTGAVPPGYLGTAATLTLPVLTGPAWEGYSRGQTGTYTLNGTAYDVRYVGKTPESVN